MRASLVRKFLLLYRSRVPEQAGEDGVGVSQVVEHLVGMVSFELGPREVAGGYGNDASSTCSGRR